MPYGTISTETEHVLREQGITYSPPHNPEETFARVDVIFAGALDESFEVDLSENDASAIVDAIFEHITSRDYARGEHVCVDAYESNGEDYNERIYVRETEEA
jgi:hypothetical protein